MWKRIHVERGDVLQLRLTEMNSEDSIPALLRGEVDLALVEAYDDLLPRALPSECDRHDLRTEHVLLATSSGALVTKVDLADHSESPWIVPKTGTFCHEMVQRACGAAGFVPRQIAYCDVFSSMLALVRVGAGVALIPQFPPRPCTASAEGRGPRGLRVGRELRRRISDMRCSARSIARATTPLPSCCWPLTFLP